MKKPIIVKKEEINMIPVPSRVGVGERDSVAGLTSLIIEPRLVDTKLLSFGVGQVNPGFATNEFHTHTSYEDNELRYIFPNQFEEIYYILHGNGIIQWKTEDGRVEEMQVSDGDIIFFPIDVVEHRLVNNSNRKIEMVFVGCPGPVNIKRLGKTQ